MVKEGNRVKVITTVITNQTNTELDFFLYNAKTNTTIKLPATRIAST